MEVNKIIEIEFAKWLLKNSEIVRQRSFNDSETYVPREFYLLLARLENKGNELYTEFLEQYNE